MTQRERLLAELQEALAETDVEESPGTNELVIRRAHRVVREITVFRATVQRGLEDGKQDLIVAQLERMLAAAPEQRERVKAYSVDEYSVENLWSALREIAKSLDYEPSGEVTLDEYKRTILQRVEALRSLAYEPILPTPVGKAHREPDWALLQTAIDLIPRDEAMAILLGRAALRTDPKALPPEQAPDDQALVTVYDPAAHPCEHKLTAAEFAEQYPKHAAAHAARAMREAQIEHDEMSRLVIAYHDEMAPMITEALRRHGRAEIQSGLDKNRDTSGMGSDRKGESRKV